jgi:YHS domain-containing protein
MQALLAFFFVVLIFFAAIIFFMAALGASFLLRAVRILFFPFKKKGGGRSVTTGVDGQPATDVMVKDPVCGTYVPMRDAIRKTIGGQSLYFCSQECLSAYKKGS